MDIHCTTCGEPWDMYYLANEAIFETALSHEEAEAWQALPLGQKLDPRYRQAFLAAGWTFGDSVIDVIRCPCCPKDAKPDPERLQIKAALTQALGDDLDGLAATFEDFGL